MQPAAPEPLTPHLASAPGRSTRAMKAPAVLGGAVATVVLCAALLLLTAIGGLDDATRATGELAEIRTFASDVGVAAHEAYIGGDSARLEATILAAEMRSGEVTRFVEDALGSAMTAELLGSMKDAWFAGADAARSYVAGESSYQTVATKAHVTAERVDALIEAIAHQREQATSRLRTILRGTIIAVLAVVGISVAGLIRARRHTALALLRAWLSEERARTLAQYDPLTGLPLVDRLIETFRDSQREGPFVAVVIDLDRFRRVNDAFGADAGDIVLRMLSSRLEGQLGDGRVSRRGGEFLALLPDCDTECVETLAAVLERQFQEPFESDGHAMWITASIGVVLGTEALGIERALARASTAALHAKAEGGARIHRCTEVCAQDATAQAELAERLREAVERDALEVHYQPQVSVSDGRVVGAEALLRWPQPGGGFIPPATFIPLLEEARLMGAVGQRVIESACRQLRVWSDQGHVLTIAVNVSPTQLTPEFPETVRRILLQTGVAPGLVELEITESVAMRASDSLTLTLAQLRSVGVGIALDDFGTGQSSLTHLREVPTSTIKLDRAFVSGVAVDSADAAIIAGMIAVAHQTGRPVVAEGVETGQQLEALAAMGCDTVQGYLLGRPVPPAEISFEPYGTASLAA